MLTINSRTVRCRLVASCVIGLLFAAQAAASTTTPARQDATAPAVHAYLAHMYWPVSLSSLRAKTLAKNIPEWMAAGDPPYLREIAQSCRRFREMEGQRPLLSVTAPAPLQREHRLLVSAYSQMRQECTNVRAIALATYAAGERAARTGTADDERKAAEVGATARKSLGAFARTTVRGFEGRLSAWRLAAIITAKKAGSPVPGWLRGLSTS
jgi:hypothetical protein